MISTDPPILHSSSITSTPVLSTTVTSLVFNTAAADTKMGSDDDGSSVGIIAGCVIGVVLCVILLLVVVLLWCYLRRRKGKLKVSQGEGK